MYKSDTIPLTLAALANETGCLDKYACISGVLVCVLEGEASKEEDYETWLCGDDADPLLGCYWALKNSHARLSHLCKLMQVIRILRE
jgi:hypothetical protein